MSSAAAGWRFTTGTIDFSSRGFRTRAALHAIAPIGVELGLWQGSSQNQTMLWLRWWDTEDNLLLTGAERASRTQQALFDNSWGVRNGIECRASGISPGFISRVRQAAFPILMQLNLAFPHKNCGFSI
ncbi:MULTISPECIES: hypothetical protein [unclassified Microcoleus]|uniref:hypothetical protein n=1 Tax=unclassified Microcoleus TaxID=2642155 RepID=UPI002FD0AEA5